MKFIDLKPLTIQRLKAYRKSLLAQVHNYDHCEACGYECEHSIMLAKRDPSYVNLKTGLDRVNKELSRKQTAERNSKLNPAHVPTLAEEKRKRKENN